MSLSRQLPPTALCAGLAVLSAACGSPPPPAAPTSEAPTTTASATATPMTETPKEQEKPAAEKSTGSPPPASKHTINGVSLSVATEADFLAALKKDGWQTDGVSRVTPGKYEQLNIWACKGTAAACKSNPQVTFILSVIRPVQGPSAKPRDGETTTAQQNKSALALNPKSSRFYDEAAEVLVFGTLTVPEKLNHPEIQMAIDRMVLKAK